MAASTRNLVRVLAGCQRLSLTSPCVSRVSQNVVRQTYVRTYAAAAVKLKPKAKKGEEDKDKKEKKEKRVIDNTGRHKPIGFTAWEPVDDVYMLRFYPKPSHDAGTAIDMLKEFQRLEFTPPDQAVTLDLKLDLKLEKKRKVDPFVSTVQLPHPFRTEANKVVVFTENAEQAQLALENGAAHAGGVELVQKILDDEIQADFYLTVPEVLPKLVPLKNKLRKKFPKSKRGTVGVNIPRMLNLFKSGHEYLVERENYIVTEVATLNMPKEQILANIQAIINDVCSHKPANYSPIINRMILSNRTSEALLVKYEDFLPKPKEEERP
ncbi:39S ribosomal protein L1, mitochondrial [Alosa sapidissima]|uniref:39S ribosomal protein L1, mitochondrial n=1 Tax=Alosa sapidissima TaxID=34773 RepID=UPI001C0A535A|nr:39S ribosomal protein L1, mitochondrial [Alosa sapidissima]